MTLSATDPDGILSNASSVLEKFEILQSKIDQRARPRCRIISDVKPEKRSLGQILSVRCPMCGAKPKERCKLSTGHPSEKTHFDRELAAAKVSRPEGFSLTVLRSLKAWMGRGFRVLFSQK